MIYHLKKWTTVMLLMAVAFLQDLQTAHAAPLVTSFSIPSTSSMLLIPVSLTASGATGYLVNETSTKPLLSNSKWRTTPPTSYLVYTSGSRVVYAWARDAAGNISPSVSRTVKITLPTTSSALCSGAAENSAMNFSCPSGKVVTSVSFASYGTPSGSCGSYQIGSCHASNSSQIVTTACKGKASCSVLASNGVFGDPCSGTLKKLSAQFVCGDAPVVSATLPTITSFSIPSTSSSLTLPISSFSVSGNNITGYLVNETSTKPLLTASNWRTTAPTSYVTNTSGTKVIYAWAKDSAGNISAPVSRTVNITLSTTTPTTGGMNTLGSLLWTTNHEKGSQSDWLLNGGGGEYNTGTGNSAVSSLRARSGVYSLKMDIDTTSGLMHGTRNYRWGELIKNMDLIHTVYYYFPTRIDLDPNNSWINIMQWKGVKYAPGGPGTGPDQKNAPLFALGLGVRGGAGTGGANYLNFGHLLVHWGGTNVNISPLVRMDLPVNQWVKVQVRYIQNRNGLGRVMFWQDDVLLFDLKNVTTFPSTIDAMHWSVNNYADRTFPIKNTIYIDDVSIHLPK